MADSARARFCRTTGSNPKTPLHFRRGRVENLAIMTILRIPVEPS